MGNDPMRKVAIVTDTTACISPELFEKNGVEQVPMFIIFGDKVFRDGIDITPSEFYTLQKQAKKLPTTSHPTPEAFLEAYRKVSKKAPSILCITISHKFSATFNSAKMAMEMAKETMPNVVIEVLDCGTAAAAQGLIILAAARAAAAGAGLPEVIETTKNVMSRVNMVATLDTLRYLVKGGRVPKAAALIGSILQIKPIFAVADGEAHPVTNARTTPGAMRALLKLIEQKSVKGKPLHAAVMHADALDRAMTLKDEISSRFKCAELFITEFTPVMGVHTGPGVIGVAFYSED
ncbi:MAG: DegV family protein [Chloroflexi bacterium]|nr:DegV family protein [Chloroflexota bacterium]